MVKDKEHSRDDLAAFFEAARAVTPEPTPDLKMRILADADRLQKADKVSKKRNWFADLKDWFHELGGAPSAIGFASSLAAGVYIGFFSPDWSEPVATLLQLDMFEDLELGDPIIATDFLIEETYLCRIPHMRSQGSFGRSYLVYRLL